MYDLTQMDIEIAEDQIDYYDPKHVMLYTSGQLDDIADEIRVSKGEHPLFNYYNNPDWPEIDDCDWYNFYVETDGKKVTRLYFSNSTSDYEEELKITAGSKRMLMNKIVVYYGGKDGYEDAIDRYGMY